MAQKSPATDRESVTTGRNSALPRRGFLHSVGGALAATALAGAGSTVSADDDAFETVELDPGEDKLVTLEDGETLENVLYDCSAEGARMTIAAHATDWTIRNVGIKGEFDVGQPDAAFGISDVGGGTSTIENVYLGDGAVFGTEATGETGFWVAPDHDGHIDFHNVNVQGFPDNGVYASAPAGAGDGTIHIDECYAANNYVSNFRIGSAGSAVTNSSVHVDDGEYGGRGVWVWSPGECAVDNCDLDVGQHNYAIHAGANGAATTVSVTDTEYSTGFHGGTTEVAGSSIELASDVGTDPDPVIPAGVPESAEEAARGD